AIVSRDPYRLAADIFGVGFRTADKIARNLGLPADSPARIGAGLAHALNEATNDGHVFLPRDELVEQTAALLELEPDSIEGQIGRTIERRDLITEAVPADLGVVE